MKHLISPMVYTNTERIGKEKFTKWGIMKEITLQNWIKGNNNVYVCVYKYSKIYMYVYKFYKNLEIYKHKK